MILSERLKRFFSGPRFLEPVQPPETMLLGWRLEDGLPQYVPDALNECHWWCLGGTRSGKTARFLWPMIKQRMERNDGPVVVSDMKGEDWLLHAVLEKGKEMDRPVKWLSNVPECCTYLFNPLEQQPFDRLFVPQLAQVYTSALNLENGPGYGKFFFGSKSRRRLASALKMRPTGHPTKAWMPTAESSRIRSFDELRQSVVEQVESAGDRVENEHLVTILEDLASIMHVNFEYEGQRLPQTAIDSAIHASELLVPNADGKYPVVYLYLRTGIEVVGAAQVMKLFLYCTFTACMQAWDEYRLGRRPQPPILAMYIDEAQCIADRALKGIIETASGFGMQFVLANQDPSQLKTDDIDLSATLWENAGNKVIFTARDPKLQQCLMDISGERTDYVPSYAVSHPAWRAGKVTPNHALHVLNGQWSPVNVAAQQKARIDRDQLVRMSASPDRFLFMPAYEAPEVGLDGYPRVLKGRFAMSETSYKILRNRSWPAPTPETIVPAEVAADRNGSSPESA